MIDIGTPAPDFELATDGGGKVRLSELLGSKAVLYFYPKDDTPACTTEALDFSSRLAEFEAAGTMIIGVSPDSAGKHDRFKKKHGLAIRLAADPDGAMLRAYGVWQEKSMFGRHYMGVVRTTLLIDAAGRVARVWEHVKVAGHVDEVLAAARAL